MDHCIYEFSKNTNEVVKAGLSEYRGRNYINIRIFYKIDGQWIPTKKGITVSCDLLSELETAIQKLKEVV